MKGMNERVIKGAFVMRGNLLSRHRTAFVYADGYYMEAIPRLKKMK